MNATAAKISTRNVDALYGNHVTLAGVHIGYIRTFTERQDTMNGSYSVGYRNVKRFDLRTISGRSLGHWDNRKDAVAYLVRNAD